ncbi:hypothetical protein G6L16_009010 [Agrobacterium tumefaciens]|uniref:hypothetical protein n=1 Tax=Agrobacterium tumefaciens TaxID=358 RepID=UPI001573A741|nr:hypothetical protein [Agrobacterium tumefaciens]NSZ63478.1 hypothetical protein [Agrobacterium tumefaciens]NTA69848.1 hypothetical protein [Agrobacterium tumefaciens]WIE36993.1 hypothetical protein G6L16_009010 [Agrobacterium tumefaciens]
MAQLPLNTGIPRFKQNEERMDRFTNGSDNQTFTTSGGVEVPTIRKFLKDKDAEIDENVEQMFDEAVGGLVTAVTAEADRSRDEADRSEAARDIAAGYASDAVSQGNVPIYATIVGMPAFSIPVGINTVRVNGYSFVGDGRGGQFIDTNNGSSETFATLDGRTWYRAEDVGPSRIKTGMDSDFQRAIGVREVLHVDRIYYVAPSGEGDNSADGLSPDSAWGTLQYAVDFVCDKLDLNGFNVAIRLMDGVHTDGLIASKNPLGVHETSSLTIKGNPSDHNAAILRVENNHAIRTGGVDGSHSLTQITLKDFRIETVGAGNYDCLINNGGAVHFAGLVFGQCTGSHITTTHLGWTYADGAYSVAKGATNYHIGCQSNGITVIHNQTVTFEEPMAFSAFVSVTAGAQAYINNVNWIGKSNVTGSRFFATLGGLVFSQYQPIDYVPGNGFWLISSGGRYNTFDGQPERITKFGDEQRISSTAMQNDTGLFFPVEPNRFYVARFVIKFNAPAPAGFSWRINGPSVNWVRLDKTWRAPGSNLISTEETDNGGIYPAAKTIAGHANETGMLEIEARVSNGPNAGQVAFQWAQAISSPSPTTVAVTSYVDWQLVG